ncbi:MAG: ABC transporter substrate-binding protein [Actinobacteria bacterium]|nr:ABC transporter substrate-binding protein [Actinomycetota bacterium]
MKDLGRARTTRRRRSLVVASMVLALVALAAGIAACGSDSETTDAGASSSAGGAATPSELRITYQLIPNGDLIVKDQGWLEEALPDTKITWVKFDSGADVNTAMIAGSVDIGLAGSSPIAAGLSEPMNIAYKVPWIHDVIGAAESLVVKNSTGVKDVAGLTGRKIGTPFGSTAHYSLLAALELNGVDPAKVKLVDLQPPDILGAWQRGDIDAAYVWNPTLAELKKDGTVLVTSEELAGEGKLTADLAVVTDSFAEAYPDAVQIWVEQQDKAVQLYRSDPQAAAEAVGRQLNISADEALAQMKDLIFLDASEQAGADYLGTPDAPGKLADNLESAAKFLLQQSSVQGVPSLATFQAGLANQFVAAAAGK